MKTSFKINLPQFELHVLVDSWFERFPVALGSHSKGSVRKYSRSYNRELIINETNGVLAYSLRIIINSTIKLMVLFFLPLG